MTMCHKVFITKKRLNDTKKQEQKNLKISYIGYIAISTISKAVSTLSSPVSKNLYTTFLTISKKNSRLKN